MSAQLVELRDADIVCDPLDLGGSFPTRHSFSRQLLREISTDRWTFTREVFDLDSDGRGTATYNIKVGDNSLTLALFSTVIEDSSRTDRVIAESWDVTGALMDRALTAADLEQLQPQVTVQEAGRALPGTIIWGRANRSVRFFNQVVDDLATGRQPDPDAFGFSPYLLRSTAFYSNGKFGMRDFESYRDDHVFTVPYRAHMLAAWLFREFSYDLVEHCAQMRNPQAAKLDGEWSRYFGLGNATGLGLVPFVINHPEILDAWMTTREYPLAAALARVDAPHSEATSEISNELKHLQRYFEQHGDEEPSPFASGTQLAGWMSDLRAFVMEYQQHGTMGGESVEVPWRRLHELAQSMGSEARGAVATVLTELTGDLDQEMQSRLVCVEEREPDPRWTLAEVRDAIETNYSWIDDFDFSNPTETAKFWFTSENSEEPRRGETGTNPGELTQHAVNVAQEVEWLRHSLASFTDSDTVGEFLMHRPDLRAIVARVQAVTCLPFGELHVNLRSANFVPLFVQRVQLAVYGMENFNPQSTDWLRVTLHSGAPRLREVNEGVVPDKWMFPLKPGSRGNREH